MHISQLPYYADAAALFALFAKQPYAVFLDSCGKGRFDIIAANPSHLIITSRHEDPFTLTKQRLLTEFATEHPDTELLATLPFTIGAIGYFSYDLGYELLRLNPTAIADIALPAAVVGFYDWSITIDHHRRATYLISRQPLDHPEIAALTAEDFTITSDFTPNLNQAQYAAAFAQIKHHLYHGDCYQINLAQRFSATYQGSPWTAYQRLRRQNPMPMAAYMNLGDEAILCLSPERFLQVNNGKVITQPIKGTAPRFSEPEQDRQAAQALRASLKDQAENVMIVDLLRNDLSKCCRPSSVQVPRLCALESFSNVHHLVSTITGILETDQHPLDLLRHCFPGGSITGAPKRRAMEIIDQLEPHHRSVYCGSLFYCDARGRLDSNIAIRTLLCSQQRIHCYGGGGIVMDSTWNSEYQEIQHKISHLLKTLTADATI
jgi:para-aminobenzoate synthetase component I